MKTIREVVSAYHELNVNDRMTFYITLSSQLDMNKDNAADLFMETKFSEGVNCPHCSSRHIVKNGRRKDGTQRYLCRDCRKSFLASTDSFLSGTHKHLNVWRKYLSCMMERKTLKESAEKCGISLVTAFQWRHKILDSLQETADSVCLSGTVEADETYTPVSFKGNHSKSHTFTMPRPAHKRGGSVSTSGLSEEQVCIPCAVDCSGIPVAGVGKLGKVSSACISGLFKDRFSPDTVLCTDHEKAYLRFSQESGLRLVQMETDHRTSGQYGIRRINAYHSKLKDFLRRCRGVSTKYLDNYLVWHGLMFCSPRSRQELEGLLFTAALAEKRHTRCRDLSSRPPLPVTV